MRTVLSVALVVVCAHALSLRLKTPVQVERWDKGISSNVDTTKTHIVYVFDNSCDGSKKARCEESAEAMRGAAEIVSSSESFSKWNAKISFAEVKKEDFPDYAAEFEKSKVSLPIIVYWPIGNVRPTVKYDATHPTAKSLSDWTLAQLKEGELLVAALQRPVDMSNPEGRAVEPVCEISERPNRIEAVASTASVDTKDATPAQDLMQVGKTEKVWDFGKGDTKFLGPADNSLPHTVGGPQANVVDLDEEKYSEAVKEKKYQALYFHADWCQYCGCLSPVWQGVADTLVGSKRQPKLVVADVDGEKHQALRDLFDVKVYPTFLIVNPEGTKVLGRYLGPRKVFEISNWVEDLIVGDQNPIVKHQFDSNDQVGPVDLHPVFPYEGAPAFGGENSEAKALAAISASNLLAVASDVDTCHESDESKFVAQGAEFLVHMSSDSSAPHALEADSTVVSPSVVPSKLTVVDFYVTWCPHCQKLSPVWDSVSQKVDDKDADVIKVNVEDHPDVKSAFGIHRFPTIMYFEAGKPMSFDEARRYKGSRDEQSLSSWIKSVKN